MGQSVSTPSRASGSAHNERSNERPNERQKERQNNQNNRQYERQNDSASAGSDSDPSSSSSAETYTQNARLNSNSDNTGADLFNNNSRFSPFSGLRLRTRASASSATSSSTTYTNDSTINTQPNAHTTVQETSSGSGSGLPDLQGHSSASLDRSDILPPSLRAHLESLSHEARGSELPPSLADGINNNSRRRRRRLSSSGSDELRTAGGSGSRSKRQNRSSLQRLRDTVMSPFANTASVSSSSSTSSSSSSSDQHASAQPSAHSHSNSSLHTDIRPSALRNEDSRDLDSTAADSDSVASDNVFNATTGTTGGNSAGDLRQNWSAALSRGRNLFRAPSRLRPGRSSSGSSTNANGNSNTNPLVSVLSAANNNGFAPLPSRPTPNTTNSFPSGASDSQAALLSRLLAIAARVTANTLVNDFSNQNRGVSFGEGTTTGANGEPVNTEEGSFRGFLDRLHRGMLASELSSSLDDSGRTRNFFRMFRFPPSSNNGEEELIPVLIVGVRAVEGTEDGHDTSGAAGPTNPLFDALSSRSMSLGDHRPGESEFRHQRDHHHHHHTHPHNHHRGEPEEEHDRDRDHSNDRDNIWSWENGDGDATLDSSASHADSSSSNSAANEFTNRLTEALENSRTSTNNDAILDDIFSGFASGRQRDRTNNRFQRPPSLHSSRSSSSSSLSSDMSPIGGPSNAGAAGGDSSSSTEPGSRRETRQSWIVYVVGGSYPRNHPILLAPSLFTDHPSYEDLLVLENFLGQEKPPVATKEDLDSAGGIVNATEGTDNNEGSRVKHDKCLVCLSVYEKGDVCRKLNECGHLFHRDCIDQWLTTGKNSCPLCRAKGVASKSAQSSSQATEQSTGPSATAE